METVKGCHGEFNMGSPGGWEYQRIAQLLEKKKNVSKPLWMPATTLSRSLFP